MLGLNLNGVSSQVRRRFLLERRAKGRSSKPPECYDLQRSDLLFGQARAFDDIGDIKALCQHSPGGVEGFLLHALLHAIIEAVFVVGGGDVFSFGF